MDSGLINLANIVQNLIDFLPSIISAVVIFILTLVAAGFTRRWLRKFFSLRKMTLQVNRLLTKIAYWSVIIIGLITALQQVGFNLTAFLTGVGIVGFTVGFALQDVSKNFISGILLLIQEPFSIGESVNVAGFAGTVEMIDLRATTLKTWDGQIVLVPNADIFTSAITNYSRSTSRRVELKVGVAYQSDMAQVQKIALEAIKGIKGLMADPAPQLLFTDFGSSTLNLSIFYWIDLKTGDLLQAKAEGLLAVLGAFDAAGIEMPFPTRQILLDKQVGADA